MGRGEKMTKKWDKLPLGTWKFIMYREDNKGNQKFYEYEGDHSSLTEGVENEYITEIDPKDA